MSGMQLTAEPRGALFGNMVLFARLLRVGGMVMTPSHVADWTRAIATIEIHRRDDFKAVTRSVLVHSADEIPWFDAAFDLFWQARDPRELEELELGILLQESTKKTEREGFESVLSAGDEEPREDDGFDLAAYSDREALGRKDFAEMTGAELRSVRQLIARLRLNLENRRSRRRVLHPRGDELDLRSSLRSSLRHGGELIHLKKRRRRYKRRPLVVLCDISGSMEPYARLLLHFIYAVLHRRSAPSSLRQVEAFVFGTHLTRITRQLRERDIDRALLKATREADDWGGGTRTGEALKEFNFRWSRRVLGRGAVVLIISDGWDRGDIPLLGTEMRRLHQSCHRLIWLNPLLGSPRYEPLTRGMQAALPHIDDFLPVHNLHSLEQLGHLLEDLGRAPTTKMQSRRVGNA